MKAVTFDFWNTLFIDQHENVRHAKRMALTHEILRSYRDSIELSAIEEAFAASHQLYLQQWDNRLAYTMDIFVRELLKFLQVQIAEEHFRAIVDCYETVLLDRPPILIESAADAVRWAAERYKLGLISDTGYTPGRTLRKILGLHGLEELFDAFSFSNETGYLKPNQQCFECILQALNVMPEDVIHVGDLEDTDIAGAKRLGMKAVKYIGSNPEPRPESIADAVIHHMRELPDALEALTEKTHNY